MKIINPHTQIIYATVAISTKWKSNSKWWHG